MSKRKTNSSMAINWLVGIAGAYFIGSAIWGAIKKRKGIGTLDDEYYIRGYIDRRNGIGDYVMFCGWTYSNGEKWAKWVDPHSRWMEYQPKEYKTLKGAEKVIEELKRLGEDEWNGDPVEFDIINFETYRKMIY